MFSPNVRVRDDVKCVIHTHSNAGVAVSCQKQGLLPINLESMGLYDKINYYDCEGVTNEADECERIAAALGDKDILILRNHGLLTCGANAAQASVTVTKPRSAVMSSADSVRKRTPTGLATAATWS